MTKREIAALACRILSIVAIILALQSYVYIAASFFQALRELSSGMVVEFQVKPEPLLDATLQILPIALLLLLALLLWKRAEWVGAKMLGETDAKWNDAVSMPMEIHPQMQSLAFSCVGLWIVVQTLSRAAPLLTVAVLTFDQSPDPLRDWLQAGVFDALAWPVQMALGLWLFFGARSFVGTISYIKRAGRDPESLRQESDDDSVSVRPEN